MTSRGVFPVVLSHLSVFAVGVSAVCFLPWSATRATTGDRNESVIIATFPFSTMHAETKSPLDGVVIIERETGFMRGGVLNPMTGKFETFYYRDLMKNFDIDEDPRFCLVTGHGQWKRDVGLQQYGAGVIYVAEVSSGKVVGYAALDDGLKGGVHPFFPVDVFDWRSKKP
jgi:hypothetical protein